MYIVVYLLLFVVQNAALFIVFFRSRTCQWVHILMAGQRGPVEMQTNIGGPLLANNYAAYTPLLIITV